MLRWYLIRTKPSAESTARTHLERQSFQTYLPRLVQTVRRKRRWLERISALFPGYVFLRLDEGRQCLRPVCSTQGVASVVRFGGRFAIVPDEVIGQLRAREDPASGLHRMRESAPLKPGTAVAIEDGPFAGLDGVFERESGADRVVVLLMLLGQESRVDFPAEFVSAAC